VFHGQQKKGVEFTLDAWTYYSAEHYDETNKTFPEISTHKIDTVIVDTTTTNQEASGINKTLNANFVDITDDGVNNPKELYYFYCFKNTGPAITVGVPYIELNISATDYPVSNSEVSVEISYKATSNLNAGAFTNGTTSGLNFPDVNPTRCLIICVKLTLINPDASLNGFDADIAFNIGGGLSVMTPWN